MNDISNTTETNDTNANILVVDDEHANIILLKKILATKGYNNVMTTVDPTEVVSLHQENNFELIMLDINMPEMNGYEVLKQLQDMDGFNNTQVVATSADNSPSHVEKALDAGFLDYITKPMRIQIILEIVDKALHKNV